MQNVGGQTKSIMVLIFPKWSIDLSCRIVSLANAAEFPIFCRALSEPQHYTVVLPMVSSYGLAK